MLRAGELLVERRVDAVCRGPMREPARHDYVALGLHVGGRTRIEHHGVFEASAGMVHLVPAGDPHRTLASDHLDAWMVGFCRTCLDTARFGPLLVPFERVRRGAVPIVELPADRQSYVVDLLRELQRETQRAAPLGAVTEGLLAVILAEVARAFETSDGPALAAPRAAHGLVADALAVVESRCLGPLSLRDVAAAVRRTPAHVAAAVRASTGRTVGEWIVLGRLSEARRRLLDTDEHVDVIAERVGYADATHFVRMFRRHTGATPAAWRAQHRASPRAGGRVIASRTTRS